MTQTRALISSPGFDAIAIATIIEQPKSKALEFSIRQTAARSDERSAYALSDHELDAIEASMKHLHSQRDHGMISFELDADHGSLVGEIVHHQ